jgi:formylglycine-generating enzyme required for sulfatase activity
MKTVFLLRTPCLVVCVFAWLGVIDGCTFDHSKLRWSTGDSGVDGVADRAGSSPVDVSAYAPDTADVGDVRRTNGEVGAADVSGAGGAAGSGGATATGAGGAGGIDAPVATGAGGTAGASGFAGMSGTGGTTGSGGTTNSGGMTASGGTTSAGGTTTTGGTTGSGGSGGGASGSGGVPASCAGLTATCGPSSESCCKSLLVPGGTFYRSYNGVDYTDESYPATVSDFYLDKYEITVGRFRQFVNAGMGTQGSPPTSGTGANPLITGSGWNSTWNTILSANTAGLEAAVKCDATYQTWTSTAGSNESQPMNCIDWYEAFAFCAWDGGRLATEAEWNYAASGGSEQRYYPWSSPPTSTSIGDDAVCCGGSYSGTQNVGSKSPQGDGKWGQSDLAGNVWEWMLDSYASPYENPCNNCADLTRVSNKVIRGGAFYNYDTILRSALRNQDNPGSPNYYIGARCARTSP